MKIKFKFDFSEDVDGFTSKDLKVTGGKKVKSLVPAIAILWLFPRKK